MRIPPATVRFVGNEEDYILSCDGVMKYCRGCKRRDGCSIDKSLLVREFSRGETYEGYTLGSWCGDYHNLNVMTNTGRPTSYVNLDDFEVVEDRYGALEKHVAQVRCVAEGLPDNKKGEVYDASGVMYEKIPIDIYGILWYVADWSGDHYPNHPSAFEPVSDPHGILDRRKGKELYWWDSASLGGRFEGDELDIDYDRDSDTLTIRLTRLPIRWGVGTEDAPFELFCSDPEIYVTYEKWSDYPVAFKFIGFKRNLARLIDRNCFMPKVLSLNTLPPMRLVLPDNFDEVIGVSRADFVNMGRSEGCLETLVSEIRVSSAVRGPAWNRGHRTSENLGEEHRLKRVILDYFAIRRIPRWYASSGGFDDVVTGERVREPLVAHIDGPWSWISQDVYHFTRYDLELRPSFIEFVKGRMRPWGQAC